MKNLTTEKALYLLASYCSKAERCTHDIKQKLVRWEIPESEQKSILNQLKKEHFLDDNRFCRAFVNDKSKYNKWGLYKIRYELKKRQISDEFIQEALSTINPHENNERLLQLLLSKKKSVKGKNEFEIKQKLMRFAVGRGYSIEAIEAIIEKL